MLLLLQKQILSLCLISLSVSGSIRYFTLLLQRQLLPGFSKLQVTVNGTVPGPSLRVTLGDRVVVNVINRIYDDASTVHWHGLNMRGTPWSDGIVNITQCPISNIPGNNTLQYTFTPDRAGTFFYHGHYHEQQQDGLYGALIVMDNNTTQSQYAKAGVSYDEDADEWTWMVADWYAVPAGQLTAQMMALNSGGPDPVPDAFTVNNKFTGKYNIKGVRRNETTRVRVIHAGTHSFFSVSVDGLPLTLIELDGVAVEPLVLPYIRVSVAQRVSFLLNWTLLSPNLTASDAVWFRFTADKSAYPQATNEPPHYNLFGTASGLPLDLVWKGRLSFTDSGVTPAYGNATPPVLNIAPAIDVNLLQARPIVHLVASDPTFFIEALVTFQTVNGFTRAYLNGATFPMSASQEPQLTPSPLLYQYLTDNGGPHMDPVVEVRNNQSFITGSATVPFVLPYNKTIEILISACCGDHPFHLHGHHFWIVSTSDNEAAGTVYADNYLMRDVVIVPSNGWVRIRFVSDNPGVWWFHCHLHWHLNMGLLATFIEAPQLLSDGKFYNTLILPESDRHMCNAPNAFNFSSTSLPSAEPTLPPSSTPPITISPTVLPFHVPTFNPTSLPTQLSVVPSSVPTLMPSEQPSITPSSSPSSEPTPHPSFRPTRTPTRLPSTAQPSVSLSSSITLTFESTFVIDGLLPVLDAGEEDVEEFVDWCVTDSAAQSLQINSAWVTIVTDSLVDSEISPHDKQKTQRQLVPLMQDATTTVQRTVLVTVTSGQFPQVSNMNALYEKLVFTLQQSAISGNYSDALKTHLMLSYSTVEVKDVQLVALSITPAVIHYPVVTLSPSVVPTASSENGFYYQDDDSPGGDDINNMNQHTQTLVIATTTVGAIVLLIVVYEMWRRGESKKRKSVHSITALDNIQLHEDNLNDDHHTNDRVGNATRAAPMITLNTSGVTDSASQFTTTDTEQGGAVVNDGTLDGSSSHSPDESSSKRYYVLEKERHVSFKSDDRGRGGSSPESKSSDQAEERHLSRQLKTVDGEQQQNVQTESSAYSYRAEEPWRLRWVG